MINNPTATLNISRLAPSPTGALHLGNARTFLINWLLGRQFGWEITLRMDDLDGPRIKKDADRQALEDLSWMGLDWDGPVLYQSQRRRQYEVAISKLIQLGLAYPCVCSRKEVEMAASAPHAEEAGGVYPGTCLGRYTSVEDAREKSGREPAIRFRVPACHVEFDDLFAGRQTFDTSSLGDFVIAKADSTPAYQLAVVIDDAGMGVSDVVRGDDLLDSTPRQIVLYRALGLEAAIPRYCHVPLVIGADGRRLAKRHGDTRISHYREMGVSPGRVVAMLARWSGMEVDEAEVMPADLLGMFDLARLSQRPIIFDERNDRLLTGEGS